MQDSFSGNITKFTVKTDLADIDLFYSPEDVSEASNNKVKLKTAFGEASSSIQYGAQVFDKNHRLIGVVDYPVSDSLTGEVNKFKVKTESATEALFFSINDVEKVTPNEIRLKVAFTKSG